MEFLFLKFFWLLALFKFFLQNLFKRIKFSCILIVFSISSLLLSNSYISISFFLFLINFLILFFLITIIFLIGSLSLPFLIYISCFLELFTLNFLMLYSVLSSLVLGFLINERLFLNFRSIVFSSSSISLLIAINSNP